MKPKRGKLLLVLGLVALLAGLGGTALGVVGIVNTSHHVAVHEGILARLKTEIADLERQPFDAKKRERLAQARQNVPTFTTGLHYYEDYRSLAYVILAGGVVGLIAGGGLLFWWSRPGSPEPE